MVNAFHLCLQNDRAYGAYKRKMGVVLGGLTKTPTEDDEDGKMVRVKF